MDLIVDGKLTEFSMDFSLNILARIKAGDKTCRINIIGRSNRIPDDIFRYWTEDAKGKQTPEKSYRGSYQGRPDVSLTDGAMKLTIPTFVSKTGEEFTFDIDLLKQTGKISTV